MTIFPLSPPLDASSIWLQTGVLCVLQYKVDKLEQEKAALAQQLQDLQGVLLALEGRGNTVQRTNTHPQPQQAPVQQPVSSSRCQPVSSFDLGLDLSQSSVDKENDCSAAAEQATQAADDWEADVAAAVGPGSLLRRPAHIAQAPSFLKSGVSRTRGLSQSNLSPSLKSGSCLIVQAALQWCPGIGCW